MNERRVARMLAELEAGTHLRSLWPATLVLAGLVLAAAAFAEDYPARPIKLIVPWPAGQATDVVSRLVTEKMAASLGQPVVVDNRPGAAGTLGTELAVRAAPDGYTVLAGSSGPISISPSVQKLSYDPMKDLEPVCRLAANPYVLVVHPSVPAATAVEFAALLRRNPGTFAYASSGVASTAHLVTELFNSTLDLAAMHVPYKGSPPAVTDLVAGHVAYTFETFTAVLPHVRAGRLRALAVTGDTRSPALPDVPTLVEAFGRPDLDVRGWQGLMVPARMPQDLRLRLAGECRKAIESPEVAARMVQSGIEPAFQMPDEFGRFLREQSERFSAVAQQARIRLD